MMASVTAGVVLSSPAPVQAVAGDDVTVDVDQEVAFDASGSTGAAPLQFLWFFGNGDAELGGLPSLSTEPETTFAYSREGVYEAILIVTDGLGRVDVDSRVVTVRNVLPAAVLRVDAFAGDTVEVQEDEVIAFDGSRSEDTEDLMYDWDFGDGEEGAGAVVEHAYAAAGRYVARLEVMDPKGARDRVAIVVQVANLAPTALASLPSEAAEDETVLFDASGSSDTPSDLADLTYIWDLGDGTVLLGQEVEHAYGLAGDYAVRLTVVDDNGASSQAASSLTIRNGAPIAVVPQTLITEEGGTTFFDASAATDTPSDLSILNYTWDFDRDRQADAYGFRATHVFTDEGFPFAELEVRDDDGASDLALTQVQVVNVAPSGGIVRAFRPVDVNLTVAGTPGHTVTITIYESGTVLAEGSSTRVPGNPAEHSVVFPGLPFTLTETFQAVVEYEPLPGENGANPAKLKLSFEDGTRVRVHHTFNVVQEETHTWIVDLDPHLTQVPIHLVGYGYDAGADDLTLRWDLGDGSTFVSFHPSDEVPTRVTEEIVHTFGLGTFTVEFRVEDEDGGAGTDEAVVSSSEGALTIDNLRPRAPLGGRVTVAEDGVLTFEAVGQDTASDRDTLSYRWSFRDGTEALGRMAEHAFAQAGTYHVLLVVTDDSGEATIDSVQVEVRNVSPLGAIVPIDPAVEDALLLFDGTGTVDTPSDAPALAFRWTFGDGSVGVGPVVGHAFPEAGDYVVTLVVQDDNGAFSEASVEITVSNVAPVASFDGPATVFVEEPALFVSTSEDTLSDEAALEIAWALGDGTTAAGRELLHTFLAPGTFSVELTITDDDGEVGPIAGTVEVQNRPPTAHIPFDLFMVYGEEGRASFRGLGFNGLSDQGSLSFSWDFGDGSTGAGAEVEHAYGTSGSFVLTLTVEDPHGAVGTDTAVVNVILDSDLDGLPDLYESQVAGTDPQNADTDGDGILDAFELLVFETEPLLQDTDFDAWTDFEEVFAVNGYVTDPLEADTDGDGLPDGSELYTQAFRTTQRFAISEQGSVDVVLPGVATGAPDFAIETADARLGLVHPRAGDLEVTLNRNGDGRSSSVDVAFPDAPNLFVSVDLLAAGFIPDELTNPATWTLDIANAGDRGTVEYFEIHIAARTSPIALDSDGDSLNDTEEMNPLDDGWITDPWRVDTDRDGVSDSLEIQGWSQVSPLPVADPEGFRTNPTRIDTDGDGFEDGEDLDPLHDLMIRLTLGEYVAIDDDPDFDNCFVICLPDPAPEPFIEVEYKGKSFFTPHEDPDGDSVAFNKVYTLDVSDKDEIVTFRLRAWDDDLAVIVGNDKQWDISPTISCDHIVAFLLSKGSEEVTTSGEGVDGDGRCRADKFLGDNANFDAQLTYVIETLRVSRINTVLVDSRDVEDLIETADGRHRYLGDSSFYIAWIHVTSDEEPFVTGLNAILVPRSQFFNSSLNHTLQTSSLADLSAYLQGLTFTAFDETAGETTNAIVGVLNGRLTGAESVALLRDLLRGADGATNGDFTVVTDELVTLGLPDRVLHAIPLEGIRFDPQGADPGTFFDDFIEAFLSAVDFVVQGLVLIGTAIAAFFEQAVDFLVELGMAVIGTIAEFLGQVAAAVEKVGEVLVELLSFVIDLASSRLSSIFASVFEVVSAAITGFIDSLDSALQAAFDSFAATGSIAESQLAAIDSVISGPLFAILAGVGIALLTLMTILTPFTLSLGVLIALLAPLLALLLWQSLLGQTGDPPEEESAAREHVPLGEVGSDVLGDAFSSMMVALLGLSQPTGLASAGGVQPESDTANCNVAVGLASFFIGRSGLFIFATLLGSIDKSRMTAADLSIVFAVFSLIVGAFAILGGVAGLVITVFAALLGFASLYFGLIALSGVPAAGTLGTISAVLGLIGIGIAVGGLFLC